MARNSQRIYKQKELAPREARSAASHAQHEATAATVMDQPPMRPISYVWNFTKGTVSGLLNGMAHAGHKGIGLGIGMGLLFCIGGGFSVAYLMAGAAAGLLGGALVGAAYGGLTGGVKDVNKARRLHKYADEVAENKAASASRPAQGTAPAYDYQDTYAAKKRISNVNFVRDQQGDRENDRDFGTYWQDREARHTHNGSGRGF